MRNALVSAAVGAIAGVAIVGTVSVLGVFDKDKRMVYATISLDRLSDNVCYINTMPQTLEVRRKETVEWTIVDRCGVTLPSGDVTRVVGIAFDSTDPLESGCVKAGKKKIRCAMKTGNDAPAYGFYKYTVTAPGATDEDPELEMVQ